MNRLLLALAAVTLVVMAAIHTTAAVITGDLVLVVLAVIAGRAFVRRDKGGA
jgi:hypothetical protein